MSCPLAWSKLDRYGSHIFACLHETVLGEMELLSMSYNHEVPPHGEETPLPLRSSCARVRVAPERHDPSTSALLVVAFLHVCMKTGVLGRLRLPTHCFAHFCMPALKQVRWDVYVSQPTVFAHLARHRDPPAIAVYLDRSLKATLRQMCHNPSQPRCGLGLLGVTVKLRLEAFTCLR